MNFVSNREPLVPLISIVVPVAIERGPFMNLSIWIPEAISKGMQVILVLDRADSIVTTDTIQEIEQSKGAIKIYGSFGSPGAARNAGLKLATGKWVFFWDADDLPNIENSIEMVREADNCDSEFAVGSFEWQKLEQNLSLSKYELTKNYEKVLVQIGINPGIWRFAFQRRLLSHNFKNLQMAEDQIFILENANFETDFYISNKIVYKYFTGSKTQQTANPKFVSHLIISLSYTTDVLLNQVNKLQRELASLFFARQFMSGLFHATLLTRIHILLKFLQLIIKIGFVDSKLIMKSFNNILQFKFQNKKNLSLTLPLTGGLGNQLFQLAAALDCREGREIFLDMSIGKPRSNSLGMPELTSFKLPPYVQFEKKLHGNWLLRKSSGFMLRRGLSPSKKESDSLLTKLLKFSWRLIVSGSFRKNIRPISGEGIGYFEIPKLRGNLLIYGYFQSYRWGELVRSEMQSLKPSFGLDVIEEFRHLAEIEKPLIVHIRLGDYRNEPQFGTLPKGYYNAALQELWTTGKYSKIWIFSDEPEFAKEYFDEDLVLQIRWIPEQLESAALTLEIMRMGCAYIIGNSSYSWWAAYLSYTPNPPVIAPEPWFLGLTNPIDLIPSNWRRINFLG